MRFRPSLHFIKRVLTRVSIPIFIVLVLFYVGLFTKLLFEKTIADLTFATGIMATATIVLAGLTYWNIHSRNAQEKRDRKERLLNEIIEWAINITECGTEKEITPMSQIEGDEMIRRFVLARATELELSFTRLKGRSQYIQCIVPISEQDLQKIVDNLIKELEVHIDLFTQTRGAILYKPGTKENIEARDMMSRKVRDHKLELDKYANEVIEEATKIKSRDIT